MIATVYHHVSRCYYAADNAGRSEEKYEDDLIQEYEDLFLQLGPKTICAVIVEPVSGASLGCVPATKNYLPKLVALCRRYGVATIFDEVMCGMGRIGSYHAWQSLGNVAPDLQTIGKGLAAGYQPVSAVLVGPSVYNVMQQSASEGKPFVSGHTYQDHSIGCATALAVQQIVKRDELVAQCRDRGELLESTLRRDLAPGFFSSGGSIRGMGLFRAIDFGSLGDGKQLSGQVAEKAFELGLAVYECSTPVDAIMLAPPFIVTEADVREMSSIVTDAINQVLRTRKGKAPLS
jgi:adenosylmethionine-8-amino-7-oxononanoate aminotransferase